MPAKRVAKPSEPAKPVRKSVRKIVQLPSGERVVKKYVLPPPELARYGIPPHKPGYCCWQGTSVDKTMCDQYSTGKRYLGRELCPLHSFVTYNFMFPRQLMHEGLNMPPTEEGETMMSYAEREAKIKGIACQGCGRNVPYVSPGCTSVWCWHCVLHRKYKGAPETLPTEVLAEGPRRASSTPREPREPSKLDEMMKKLVDGKESYTFEGGKGTNVFTAGGKAGTIAVQDHKGVTTYEMGNEDHNRIVTARVQRWIRKQDPTVKAGKVPVKGPKLEVRIKGGEE